VTAQVVLNPPEPANSRLSVQAMKGGAIEFLTKPFRDQDLLDAIQVGLAEDRARLQNEKPLADLRALLRP